jgi:hypothetical protein
VLPLGLFDSLCDHLRDDVLASFVSSTRTNLIEQTRELFRQNQDLFWRPQGMKERMRKHEVWTQNLLTDKSPDAPGPQVGSWHVPPLNDAGLLWEGPVRHGLRASSHSTTLALTQTDWSPPAGPHLLDKRAQGCECQACFMLVRMRCLSVYGTGEASSDGRSDTSPVKMVIDNDSVCGCARVCGTKCLRERGPGIPALYP